MFLAVMRKSQGAAAELGGWWDLALDGDQSSVWECQGNVKKRVSVQYSRESWTLVATNVSTLIAQL